MDCTFTIEFTGSADALAAAAKAQVESNNGTFNGDAASGSFYVPVPLSHISGTYTIAGQQLNVIVTDKPFVIGCGTIQRYVEGHLGH